MSECETNNSPCFALGSRIAVTVSGLGLESEEGDWGIWSPGREEYPRQIAPAKGASGFIYLVYISQYGREPLLEMLIFIPLFQCLFGAHVRSQGTGNEYDDSGHENRRERDREEEFDESEAVLFEIYILFL